MSLHGYSDSEYQFDNDSDDNNITLISKLDMSSPLHLHPNDSATLTVAEMLYGKKFDALVQLPRCTCHAAEDFKKHNSLMKLMQFLMGLDDSYMQIRSNILSRDPLPNVRGAYAVISSEESHRVVSTSSVETSQRSQSSVFNSSVSNRGVSQRPPNSGNSSRNNNGSRPSGGGNRRTNGGPQLVCENCGFNGHSIDRCFKLIGYPVDFGKRNNNNNNTNQGVQNFNRRFINNNSVGSRSSSTFLMTVV
ncbi:hypothetical protein Tco_0820406 [Tanacetum coccineum]|uniref:Uncharacterized protein n=1 Tax=Tanacetum coccineum TaxID=301880 RepID=A0ABQ5ABX4_9ASTR